MRKIRAESEKVNQKGSEWFLRLLFLSDRCHGLCKSPPSLKAFLLDAYVEDEAPNTKGGDDKRTVLRFDPRLAPIKAAVLPPIQRTNGGSGMVVSAAG